MLTKTELFQRKKKRFIALADDSVSSLCIMLYFNILLRSVSVASNLRSSVAASLRANCRNARIAVLCVV